MSEPLTPATVEPAPLAQAKAVDTTPMGILASAVAGGAPIDTIERLVALQEKMAASAAEQAWSAAMSRAQAAMGRISADATNPQTHSHYATYAAIDRHLRPIYSREGFALSFGTEQAEGDFIIVLCHVAHMGGCTKTFRAPMPTDGKGAKGNDVMTKTHATGAAMSYGMRYLLKMIFNVAVGEEDRDGNSVDLEEVEQNCSRIREAKTPDELQKVYLEFYTPAYNAKPQQKDACKAYIAAKDARLAQLRGAK